MEQLHHLTDHFVQVKLPEGKVKALAEGCGHPALPWWCSQPPWALASPSLGYRRDFSLLSRRKKEGPAGRSPRTRCPTVHFFWEAKPGWSQRQISPFEINPDHARNCPVTHSTSASLQTVNASGAWSPSLTVCKYNWIHQMRLHCQRVSKNGECTD